MAPSPSPFARSKSIRGLTRSKTTTATDTLSPNTIPDHVWDDNGAPLIRTTFSDLKNRPSARQDLRQQFSSTFQSDAAAAASQKGNATSEPASALVKEPVSSSAASASFSEGSHESSLRGRLPRSQTAPGAVVSPSSGTTTTTSHTAPTIVEPQQRQLAAVDETGPAQIDVASAIALLEQLKKTASPEQLVALHRALLPSKDVITPVTPMFPANALEVPPPVSTSAGASSSPLPSMYASSNTLEVPSSSGNMSGAPPMRKSALLTPGLATRIILEEEDAPARRKDNSGSSNFFLKPVPAKAKRKGRLGDRSPDSATGLYSPEMVIKPFAPTGEAGERSFTPDMGYTPAAQGGYTYGSLRITNGAASPEPPLHSPASVDTAMTPETPVDPYTPTTTTSATTQGVSEQGEKGESQVVDGGKGVEKADGREMGRRQGERPRSAAFQISSPPAAILQQRDSPNRSIERNRGRKSEDDSPLVSPVASDDENERNHTRSLSEVSVVRRTLSKEATSSLHHHSYTDSKGQRSPLTPASFNSTMADSMEIVEVHDNAREVALSYLNGRGEQRPVLTEHRVLHPRGNGSKDLSTRSAEAAASRDSPLPFRAKKAGGGTTDSGYSSEVSYRTNGRDGLSGESQGTTMSTGSAVSERSVLRESPQQREVVASPPPLTQQQQGQQQQAAPFTPQMGSDAMEPPSTVLRTKPRSPERHVAGVFSPPPAAAASVQRTASPERVMHPNGISASALAVNRPPSPQHRSAPSSATVVTRSVSPERGGLNITSLVNRPASPERPTPSSYKAQESAALSGSGLGLRSPVVMKNETPISPPAQKAARKLQKQMPESVRSQLESRQSESAAVPSGEADAIPRPGLGLRTMSEPADATTSTMGASGVAAEPSQASRDDKKEDKKKKKEKTRNKSRGRAADKEKESAPSTRSGSPQSQSTGSGWGFARLRNKSRARQQAAAAAAASSLSSELVDGRPTPQGRSVSDGLVDAQPDFEDVVKSALGSGPFDIIARGRAQTTSANASRESEGERRGSNATTESNSAWQRGRGLVRPRGSPGPAANGASPPIPQNSTFMAPPGSYQSQMEKNNMQHGRLFNHNNHAGGYGYGYEASPERPKTAGAPMATGMEMQRPRTAGGTRLPPRLRSPAPEPMPARSAAHSIWPGRVPSEHEPPPPAPPPHQTLHGVGVGGVRPKTSHAEESASLNSPPQESSPFPPASETSSLFGDGSNTTASESFQSAKVLQAKKMLQERRAEEARRIEEKRRRAEDAKAAGVPQDDSNRWSLDRSVVLPIPGVSAAMPALGDGGGKDWQGWEQQVKVWRHRNLEALGAASAAGDSEGSVVIGKEGRVKSDATTTPSPDEIGEMSAQFPHPPPSRSATAASVRSQETEEYVGVGESMASPALDGYATRAKGVIGGGIDARMGRQFAATYNASSSTNNSSSTSMNSSNSTVMGPRENRTAAAVGGRQEMYSRTDSAQSNGTWNTTTTSQGSMASTSMTSVGSGGHHAGGGGYGYPPHHASHESSASAKTYHHHGQHHHQQSQHSQHSQQQQQWTSISSADTASAAGRPSFTHHHTHTSSGRTIPNIAEMNASQADRFRAKVAAKTNAAAQMMRQPYPPASSSPSASSAAADITRAEPRPSLSSATTSLSDTAVSVIGQPRPRTRYRKDSELTTSTTTRESREREREGAMPDRYSNGFQYGWDREQGFTGSAGTRTGADTKSEHRKSKQMSESFGLDLSDVPVFLKKV